MGDLTFKNGWWIARYVDAGGKRRRHRVSRIEREARQILSALEGQAVLDRRAGIKPLKPIRFREFSQKFLKHARSHMKAWARYQSSLRSLNQFFGNQYLTAIDAESIEKYKEERLKCVEPATINRDMQVLRRAFNLGLAWSYLRESPMRFVRFFKESFGRVRYLTREEFGRLMAVLPEHLVALVIAAVHTGMRQGELLGLRWMDVDFENNFLSIYKTKNDDPAKLPLNRQAREALLGIRLKNKTWVFTDAEGQKLSPRTLQWQFRRALAEARIEEFRFHDLRHTCASWLAMAGVPILTIKEILRQKDIRMTLRYAHLSPDHRVDAVKKLDRFARKMKPPENPDVNAGNPVTP